MRSESKTAENRSLMKTRYFVAYVDYVSMCIMHCYRKGIPRLACHIIILGAITMMLGEPGTKFVRKRKKEKGIQQVFR